MDAKGTDSSCMFLRRRMKELKRMLDGTSEGIKDQEFMVKDAEGKLKKLMRKKGDLERTIAHHKGLLETCRATLKFGKQQLKTLDRLSREYSARSGAPDNGDSDSGDSDNGTSNAKQKRGRKRAAPDQNSAKLDPQDNSPGNDSGPARKKSRRESSKRGASSLKKHNPEPKDGESDAKCDDLDFDSQESEEDSATEDSPLRRTWVMESKVKHTILRRAVNKRDFGEVKRIFDSMSIEQKRYVLSIKFYGYTPLQLLIRNAKASTISFVKQCLSLFGPVVYELMRQRQGLLFSKPSSKNKTSVGSQNAIGIAYTMGYVDIFDAIINVLKIEPRTLNHKDIIQGNWWKTFVDKHKRDSDIRKRLMSLLSE